MTTQNNAAQPVLTDDQIEPLVRNAADEIERLRRALEAERDLRAEREKAADPNFVMTELRGIICVAGDSPTVIVSVERMRLWLSKLRAPVAEPWPVEEQPDGTVTAVEPAEILLDHAMYIAHERELEVTGHTHDSEGAVRRFKAVVERALLRAPVADEPVLPPLPEVMMRTDWLRGYADTAEMQAKSYSHGTMHSIAKALREIAGWCDARVALASAPVAGEASERLDAPAQVGGTRFGKGIHWSTVIRAAQQHHQYMQDPAREAERIAQAKRFQAFVAGDAAPQASSVAGEAAGEIVLFGSDLKEVSWRDGKMPPAGTKLYAAPQAPAGWRWTLHPAGLHPDVYAAAAAHTSDEARNAALEEAAHLMEQTGKRIAASDIRALKSTPAPTAVEGSEDDMLTIAYLAGAQAEKERAALAAQPGAIRNPLIAEPSGNPGELDCAALAARKEGDGNAN
ncbi:hypothetical protein [Bordetella bronchiseptica]|uniref:hypothetical protein n=1 Tax=Bordetella bronchiseptica TaxID=518 RepID=UPI0010C520D2|nr:hypothetical protein [Bordetella bronchiseptica]QBS70787.1 hypothetical protein B2C13_19975 [Bordetella bronchiseptica]